MKRITLAALLVLYVSMGAHAQGLEFSTFESETVSKTSYEVFAKHCPVFKDSFLISFDLSIHDPQAYGYILRLNDTRSSDPQIFSLVFTYDNFRESNLKFNIEAHSNLATDTLEVSQLHPYAWLPVKIQFFLQADSVALTIRDKRFVSTHVGLPKVMKPRLLFGSSTFSQEIPPFAIKNLTIEGTDKAYYFPLNESEGTRVHDSNGKVRGLAVNPEWRIQKSYHWHKALTYRFQQVAGTCYDPVQGRMLFFSRDTLVGVSLPQGDVEEMSFPPIPMDLQLGTGFYNPTTQQVYAYEVHNPGSETTVGTIDEHTLAFSPVSDMGLSSLRHHHACYLDTLGQKYYIFGGFGSRMYYNLMEVLDLKTGEWQNLPLTGDTIQPRFFASMGALNDKELLLFGGSGNPTADQAVGELHYYDLYTINRQTGKVTKRWEIYPKGENFVPVRSLLLDDQGSSFYTLCYPKHLANSQLQLYRFSVQDGSYEVLAQPIPMESKAILSNANLYYSVGTNEFCCCVQEFQEYGGSPSIITLYTLMAPPISERVLRQYRTHPLLNGMMALALGLALLAGAAVFLLKKRDKVAGPALDPSSEQAIEEPPLPSQGLPTCSNAIYLFGELTIINKHGRDVTYMFSNKIRQLFLLTLLKSLNGSGGISSSYIYGTIWPDKDIKSAKNLKGVIISRLRKILEEFEGLEFVYNNNLYSISLPDSVYCDYSRYLTLVEEFKQTDSLEETKSSLLSEPLAGMFPACKLQDLLEILKRGKFLASIDDEIFDSLKAGQEEAFLGFIMPEIRRLFEQQDYQALQTLAKAVFKVDPLNETAMWYLLQAYRRQKKEDKALKRYYQFTADFTRVMGVPYKYSYQDLIRCDIADLMK